MTSLLKQPAQAVRNIVKPQQATEAKAAAILQQELNKEAHFTDDQGNAARDPVTGELTTIKNSSSEPEHRGENVLSMPFPPPDLEGQKRYMLYLFRLSLLRLSAAYLIFPTLTFWISPDWLSSKPLLLFPLSLIAPSLLAVFLLFRLDTHAAEHADQQAWHTERLRGQKAGYDVDADGKIEVDERIRESAEWFNSLLKGIWPIINPDLFTAAVDMIEDIMQSSVPTFIHTVQISDLGQGINPPRITSIRALPDSDMESVTGNLDERERGQIQGDHINLEIAFAYKAIPATSRQDTRAQNAHLLLEFYLGLRGVVGVPVPIWAEITGAVGIARVRAELIPDPPFIKHTLITLMGLPHMSLSITPLHKKLLPNVMDIPFLSGFISSSINMAMEQYVAPRSLMLDLQTLLGSDGIKRDTDHIGVIIVHIHNAKDLKCADQGGGRIDPYICVCFSPMNKVQYSTRIVMNSLDPIFEETAVLLVDANAAKVNERVSLQVWDSDRFTVDDMVGHVEIDVVELMENKNNAVRRTSPLKRPLSHEMNGNLEYTIGFYPMATPGVKDNSNNLPRRMLESKEFRDARKDTMSDIEAAVTITPPSHAWPSGILSLQLHEIRELGIVKDGPSLNGRREERPGGGEDDNEELEAGQDLPSAYCTVLLDDEPIYRTRSKPMTSTPFFNASTERFVRDWRSSHICVVVRDSRLREQDPIIGMVYIKLADLFENTSQVTRSWSLQRGIGYGSIRLSFLFRGCQAKLPKPLMGFNTGTLEITRVVPHFKDTTIFDKAELRFHTSAGLEKVKRTLETGMSEGDDSSSSSDEEKANNNKTPRLPVQARYRSSLKMRLKQSGLLHRKTLGLGVLWLRDLEDHESTTIRVKVWKAGDLSFLKHNYMAVGDASVPNFIPGAEELGEVELTVKLIPGVSEVHERSYAHNANHKRTWEEYTAIKDAGWRNEVGKIANIKESTNDESETNTMVHPNHTIDDEANGFTDTPRSNGSQSSNPIAKIREWRDHEDNLQKTNRGLKQHKVVRTAEWLGEGAKDAGFHVKSRFKRTSLDPKMDKEA